MPVNTYDHIFTKGPESALPVTPEDGKLRLTTDTGRLFIDGQNSRTEVTDFVKGMTEAEIKSQLAPLASKIYISSDTNKFLIYDGTAVDPWINIANSGQADYATNAGTSVYAANAGTATEANHAASATNASTSTYADNSGTVNGKTVAVNVPSDAKFTDTTYSGANGVSLSGTTFSNSGVRSVAEGTANGTINVNTNGSTANVNVHGLGSNAFNSTAYLPLAGGTMTGCLNIESTQGNFREGIRVNQGDGYYSTILIGAPAGSTSGTADGAFWIGTNPVSKPRKLFIGHNDSVQSTYFYATSASDKSPSLQLGGELKIGGESGPRIKYNTTTQSIDFIFA